MEQSNDNKLNSGINDIIYISMSVSDAYFFFVFFLFMWLTQFKSDNIQIRSLVQRYNEIYFIFFVYLYIFGYSDDEILDSINK